MSYWVSILNEDNELLEVNAHSEGGTYALGGVSEADLNITYNYCHFYYEALGINDGLRGLNDMAIEAALPLLVKACSELPDMPENDYWADTEGNAGHAIHILLGWAQQAASQENTYHIEVH